MQNSLDSEKLKRFKQLQAHFKKETFLQCDGYYMQIRYHDRTDGTRFYFRGRYLVEMVVSDEEGHKNIAPFVLFSNKQDAILCLILTEDSYHAKQGIKLFKKGDKVRINGITRGHGDEWNGKTGTVSRDSVSQWICVKSHAGNDRETIFHLNHLTKV